MTIITIITIGSHRLARDTMLYSPGMPALCILAGSWVHVISVMGTRVRIECDGYYGVVPRDAIVSSEAAL